VERHIVLRISMKRLALVTVSLSLFGLVGCGGGDGGKKETEALRKEVASLRQQLSTTPSTTASTTVATEPTTTTTAPATTTTTNKAPKASPTTTTTGRPTTTTAQPTTTTTQPTTTTTTRRQPQGTVTWSSGSDGGMAGACRWRWYHFYNRSDTAVLDVTISGVYIVEYYNDENGYLKSRNGVTLPSQTVPAGIAPYGERDVSAKWCPDQVTPGTKEWYTSNDKAGMTWRWVQ
jgi:cytoskeletal protein RodZ